MLTRSLAATLATAASALSVPPRSATVWCYGDSLTAGFHDHGRGFSPYSVALEQTLREQGIDLAAVHQ